MPRFIQNYMAVLSKDEQILYDSLDAKAKKVSRGETRRSSEAAVLQLWQSCNSLTSCAEMISSNNNFQDLRGKPKLLKKWVNLLQEEKDYYCPICLDQPDDAVITRCAHFFCKSCIMHLIEKYKISKSFHCPMCRRRLEKCHIFESSVPDKMKPGSSSANNMSSSKVSALITMLRKSTNSKSVVLSQFRRTLELVDGMLSDAGWNWEERGGCEYYQVVCKKSVEEKVLEIRKIKPAYGRREVTMSDAHIDWLLGFENIPDSANYNYY
ncbi:unnamed protein product [Rhodiola kirilowii]